MRHAPQQNDDVFGSSRVIRKSHRQKTRLHRGAAVGVACLAIGTGLGGCDTGIGDLANSVDGAVDSINQAINALDTTSVQWQDIMRGLIEDLPELENDIKADVQETLERATSGATTDLIATSDFFARRMREGLLRARAKLTGEPYLEPPPAFISFVPDKCEIARVKSSDLTSITVYGYDFDKKDPSDLPLQLKLLEGSQLVDVTYALTKPTHYRAVFNLGSNGVPLTQYSNQLQLVWGGEVISTLAVVQPPVPQPREITVGLSSFTYIPPHTRGDQEFDGNGPSVYLRAGIGNVNNRLIAVVYMKAEETEDDWTTAEGWSEWRVVYTPPPGVQILSILSPLNAEASYVDTDHALDDIDLTPYDLVNRFRCVGDTDDDNDAGTLTRVTVEFNQIKLMVVGPE